MTTLPRLELNPVTLLELLRRAFWWLVFVAVGSYLPFHVGVMLHPDRWVSSGFRDLIVMLGWLGVCRLLATRWPKEAVIVCLLGLLPISALALTAPTEVIRQLNANATTRILLTSAILFALGLFGRWFGVLTGTLIAVVANGQDANALQLAAGGNVLFSIGMYGSLTRYVLDQLVRAQLKLERSAVTDSLTGLGNRRALELDHAAFEGAWLTVWDVDDLKRVNDTFGHAAGDKYLLEFTAALRVSLLAGDRAFRTGGDEFVTLTRAESDDLVARVRARFPSVSVGSSRLERDLDLALLEADTNLYDDKRSRKATPVPDEQTSTSG